MPTHRRSFLITMLVGILAGLTIGGCSTPPPAAPPAPQVLQDVRFLDEAGQPLPPDWSAEPRTALGVRLLARTENLPKEIAGRKVQKPEDWRIDVTLWKEGSVNQGEPLLRHELNHLGPLKPTNPGGYYEITDSDGRVRRQITNRIDKREGVEEWAEYVFAPTEPGRYVLVLTAYPTIDPIRNPDGTWAVVQQWGGPVAVLSKVLTVQPKPGNPAP